MTSPSDDDPASGPVDLFLRIHALSGEDMLVVSRDFGSELEAAQAIACALDDRRSLTFAHASFSRETQESVVVVNPSNVVAVRISRTDSAATGQYL
ncbi:MAG: hypothetical protein ACXVYY_14015 [Oryzihumus sp.]